MKMDILWKWTNHITKLHFILLKDFYFPGPIKQKYLQRGSLIYHSKDNIRIERVKAKQGKKKHSLLWDKSSTSF